MKSLLRLACLAAMLPAPAFAAEASTIDVYRELIRHRTATVGAANALDYDTRGFVSSFLEDPDSPYSNLRDDPPISNEVWWFDFVDSLSIDAGDANAAALEMLQWQGGLTKARPGIEVTVSDKATNAYRGREVAANAIKAGVDRDIFYKAWDMNAALTTVAAGHAVALQLLRDQVRNNAPDTYEARGIKPGVLTRYLRETYPERLDESDLSYLASLLRFALSKQSFTVDAEGQRQLPAAYRVARVAAAYSDGRAYTNPTGYCHKNGPLPGAPTGADATEYHRPLCFVAATDRAVHSWYRREIRVQAARVRMAHQTPDHVDARVSFWINTVLLLTDLAPFVEFGEAAVVEELAFEGGIAEEDAAFARERANQLTCRIRP
jgi:hypothetical protein